MYITYCKTDNRFLEEYLLKDPNFHIMILSFPSDLEVDAFTKDFNT